MFNLFEQRGDDLQTDVYLVTHGDSVLHRHNYPAKLLRQIQQVQSHVVEELRVVQVIELYVVADLRYLADIESSILLHEVASYFLPSLQLDKIWLSVANDVIPVYLLIDAYTHSLVHPARVRRGVVLLLLELFDHLVRLHGLNLELLLALRAGRLGSFLLLDALEEDLLRLVE